MDKLTLIKDQYLQNIKNSSAYKKFINWYNALPSRDAKILKILSALTILVLIFSWVIQPTISSIKTSENKLAAELKFHTKLKENAFLFKSTGANTNNNNGSILSRVNGLAKEKGIKLKRFEPNGDSGLRVWLEKINFNSAIDWIETLEVEQGIKVEQISIDKVDNGIVNLRAVLKL